MGAASAAWLMSSNTLPQFATPYLGYDIANDDILEEIRKYPNLQYVNLQDIDNLVADAANSLHQQKVIGWIQGRSEFGPRALGNRSILANPSSPEAQDFVNRAVKFREPFRPFAPAVLAHKVYDLYECDDASIESFNHPLRFMLSTLSAKDSCKSLLPACIHVDGTSRVQSVTEHNERFYKLISQFYALSGIPGVLNTSYNLRGEPMVNTFDALSTFIRSGMDVLYVDTVKITKSTP